MSVERKVFISEHEDVGMSSKYYSKVQNARIRGIDFFLSFDAFKDLKRKNHCVYTGVPFEPFPKGSDTPIPHQQTIERINPFKPYADDNCTAITYEANCAKSHLDAFLLVDSLDLNLKKELLKNAIRYLQEEIESDKANHH